MRRRSKPIQPNPIRAMAILDKAYREILTKAVDPNDDDMFMTVLITSLAKMIANASPDEAVVDPTQREAIARRYSGVIEKAIKQSLEIRAGVAAPPQETMQ